MHISSHGNRAQLEFCFIGCVSSKNMCSEKFKLFCLCSIVMIFMSGISFSTLIKQICINKLYIWKFEQATRKSEDVKYKLDVRDCLFSPQHVDVWIPEFPGMIVSTLESLLYFVPIAMASVKKSTGKHQILKSTPSPIKLHNLRYHSCLQCKQCERILCNM